MTQDDAEDRTSPTPQGSSPYDAPSGAQSQPSSPYDQTSPWSKPPTAPAGPGGPTDVPPAQPYASPSGQPQPSPYGPPPPYGQSYAGPQPAPYGQQPYGAPGNRSPEAVRARSSATLWLVLNVLLLLALWWTLGGLLGIVGAVFAGVGLSRVDVDVADAARKARTAKFVFFAGLAVSVVVLAIAVAGTLLFLRSDFGSPSDLPSPAFSTTLPPSPTVASEPAGSTCCDQVLARRSRNVAVIHAAPEMR